MSCGATAALLADSITPAAELDHRVRDQPTALTRCSVGISPNPNALQE